MSTLTTNYSLIKPGVNDATDQDLWGGYLNTDLDSLDSLTKIATDHIKRDVTTTDTVLITDRNKMILCDATSASFVETLLPAATAGDGFSVIIVKSDSTANTVTIDGDGSETISGATTYVLSNEGDAVGLSCDGANWFITGSSVIAQDASETVKGIVELATQVEVDAGTDAVRAITPATLASNLGTNLGFSNVFTSAEQTITSGSSVSIAHSLGSIPTLIIAELVCKTTNLGYAVDDRIAFTTVMGSSSSVSRQYVISSNATNVTVSYDANVPIITSKTGGASQAITIGSWKVVIRAWA